MDRTELYKLIDALPDGEEHVAKRFLQFLCDSHPLYTSENAPYDDEPLTEEDKRALEEAEEDIRAGRVISHEELKRSLNL